MYIHYMCMYMCSRIPLYSYVQYMNVHVHLLNAIYMYMYKDKCIIFSYFFNPIIHVKCTCTCSCVFFGASFNAMYMYMAHVVVF